MLVWSEISGAGLLLLSPHEACNLQHSYELRRVKQLIGGDASHGLPHVRGGRPDKTVECDVIRGGHHIGPAPRDDRDPEVYTTDILILPRTRAQPASPYPSSATATIAFLQSCGVQELNPARFKLRESLDLLQEKGYELGAGGDIGLIALNEHLAGSQPRFLLPFKSLSWCEWVWCAYTGICQHTW